MNSLRRAFAEHPALRPGTGAALCVCAHGQVQCSLVKGENRPSVPWNEDTLVPVFSATKPASAACFLQALAEHGGDPRLPIGELWSKFPAPSCTVEQFLSHQAGLAAWDTAAPIDDLDACRAAVEHSVPLWLPPQHGYHPHTFGPMLDILMLALTGKRIGAFWEERVRRPLGLDFYIGLPESLSPRVAILQAPRIHGSMPDTPFYRAYFDPSSPVYRSFNCVTGLPSPRAMNSPFGYSCACPARGGIASARGLALFYQALLGQLPHSPFDVRVTEWMSHPVTAGQDLTLLCHTAFSRGAMCEPAALFGNGGFGHAGFGGSHAFAHPGSHLSFAYVTNAMQLGVLPGEYVQHLVATIFGTGVTLRTSC